MDFLTNFISHLFPGMRRKHALELKHMREYYEYKILQNKDKADAKEAFERNLPHINNLMESAISIEVSKTGSFVVAYCNPPLDTESRNIDIYLLDTGCKRRPEPRLYAKLYRSDTVFIEIIDLINEENSMGYGSILMNALMTIAKKFKASYITGMLSFVDQHNFVRSVPFYEKYGFTITWKRQMMEGYIKKIL